MKRMDWVMRGVILSVVVLAGGCATTPTDEATAPRETAAGEVATGYQPVQSETIYSVNYNEDQQMLTVVLYEEGVYDYSNVPAEIYRGLLDADDPDQYYETVVKQNYTGEKFELE